MVLEFDADAEELTLFLAENDDHLQILDQNIIRLEQKPEDPELLQQIFRSAHTIKGGAGMIGHTRMAELAHDMENVLDALRSRAVDVTQQTIDALLAALDVLGALNQEVVTRIQADLPVDAVRCALAACLTKQSATPDSPQAITGEPSQVVWPYDAALDVIPEDVSPEQVYVVSVSVDRQCALPAARTYQAFLLLQRRSRLIRTLPGPEQIEKDEETRGLLALLALSGPGSQLEAEIRSISDIAEVRVEAFHVPAPAGSEAGAGALDTLRATSDRPTPGQDSMIRISVGIVDGLMGLVSELVLGRTRLQTLCAQLQARLTDDETVASLDDAVGHLDQVVTDLQTTVMKARMLPIENVFNKFPRLVRDLSAQSGKQVNFSMSGRETELDRSVIEQLADPLVHLLRNALDHGIELPADRRAAGKPPVGSIALSATPGENHILIKVHDDGAGIDPAQVVASALHKGLITQEAAARLSDQEALELIFLPGLTTARSITDISGRGVGMDIVKSTIARMGGRIAIESTIGKGSTFSITLPLTLAIMQVLLVSVEQAVYALPLNVVTEILSVDEQQIHDLQGTEVTVVRGAILPLLRLREYFGRGTNPVQDGRRHIVATRIDGQQLGLVVDHFIGEQEIVIKPLGTYLGVIPGLAGATVLGDGQIGLLIDVSALRTGLPTQRVA